MDDSAWYDSFGELYDNDGDAAEHSEADSDSWGELYDDDGEPGAAEPAAADPDMRQQELSPSWKTTTVGKSKQVTAEPQPPSATQSLLEEQQMANTRLLGQLKAKEQLLELEATAKQQ